MKKLFQLFVFLLFISGLNGQENNYAVGLRGGYTHGVIFRQYLSDNSGYLGIASGFNHEVKFTLIKEVYSKKDLAFFNNVTVVKGFGGHVGINEADNFSIFGQTYKTKNKSVSPVLGIDGLIGAEYKIAGLPIILGLDYKPYFEFSTIKYFNIQIWDVGFYVMYTF